MPLRPLPRAREAAPRRGTAERRAPAGSCLYVPDDAGRARGASDRAGGCLLTTKTLLARDPALLSEAEWSGLVLELARLGGWQRRYHTFTAKRSAFGFPDWVLVKPPRLIFAELKTEVGKLTDAQQDWRADLLEVEAATKGLVQHYVWRPSDYPTVVEILTGRKPL